MKKVWVIGSVAAMILLMIAIGTFEQGFYKENGAEQEFIVKETEEALTIQKEKNKLQKPLGDRPEGGWCFGLSDLAKGSGYYTKLSMTLRGYISAGGDYTISMNSEDDVKRQIEQLQEMERMGVDAIFVNPVDSVELLPILEELKEKNIPVIMMEQGMEETEQVISVVDSDNFNSGFILADYMVNNCTPGKDIYNKAGIVIFTERGKNFGKEKRYGFRSAIGDSYFRVEKEVIVSHDEEVIRKEFENLLEEVENLQYIFSTCDEITTTLLKLCEEKKCDNLKIFSAGGSPELKKIMVEGNENLEAFAAESPVSLAMNAYSVMMQYLDGQAVKKQYLTETFLVNRDNIEEYRVDTWQ
ncbi:MAG: substrate-binding domain-containing protein [Acetivibrio ethanolgignens]